MQILREPLLHFTLIGALLFSGYGFLNRDRLPETGIVVSDERIEQLANTFSNDWNRAASAEELELLIDEYVREELAFREGMELGLDQDDPVIRQRIRQKLELMAEEEAVVRAPSDAELQGYLAEQADLFGDENGALPPLDDIRNLVLFEWENQQRLAELENFYQKLQSKYGVKVARKDK
ncbi:hypothetical protein P4E94_06045 [Pontiellaceae bacterium B12219]|nr:hypothetical protein [Pontiellaceae bacterium B12219]